MKKTPRKIHSSLISAVFQVIRMVFDEGKFADKALESVMKANKYWQDYERRYVSDTSYEIIRWWRLFSTIADVREELSDTALYKILGVHYVLNELNIEEVKQLENVNPRKIIEKYDKYQKVRKIRESLPDWLDQQGEKELGARWDSVIEALNRRPSVYLRTNTMKTSARELNAMLGDEGIDTHPVPLSGVALKLDRFRNVFRSKYFKEGLFEIQDLASQAVSEMLDVKPGMKVIDACAGYGGKTLHLACIMGNKGKIIAMDTEAWKLEQLRTRASRASVQNIEIRPIESSKTVKRLYDTADRLLLDVPCSGSGVLKRNPDTKWKLQREELEKLQATQQEILDKYSRLVKAGGKLVYATCSIFPSEGELQVRAFLDKHPEWSLFSEKRWWPDEVDCDGFYTALLERKASDLKFAPETKES